MKRLLLSVALLLHASLSFADSFNQNRAQEMITILQSAQVQKVLAENDKLGLLTSIESIPSVTWGITYKLNFSSNQLGGRDCSFSVDYDSDRQSVGHLHSLDCEGSL